MIEEPYIVHNVYGGFNETKPREFHNVSPTIRTPQGGGHLPMLKTGQRIRRLTPRECERLQGFPDDWTKYGKSSDHDDNHCDTCTCTVDEQISDTQRYKMCGNAVTTNVVQAVMERLYGQEHSND